MSKRDPEAKLNAHLEMECHAGYFPVCVQFPDRLVGCRICRTHAGPFIVGALGARDKKNRMYVFTFVTTCEPCKKSESKMEGLVMAMLALPRPEMN